MIYGGMILVFVVDGLRPDAFNAEDTPTLERLRREGVDFVAGHSVFPTVTRVNAATIATGAQPATHGIVGNQMYAPAVYPTRAFGTDGWKNLVKLDEATEGRLVFVPTLAERLQAQDKRLAAVSSGSTGSAFLLNPRAPRGVGILINGYLEPGTRVAYPDAVNAAVLARFGPAPAKGGRTERYDPVVDWTQTVLADYVIPELRPDVVVNWMTEPDHIQHALGAGSPDARAAIRNADTQIERVLRRAGTIGLDDEPNVFVVSDHGFGVNTGTVDVTGALIDAGLKAGPDSDDVIVASSGQAMALHVKDRSADRIHKLVAYLHARPWIGVIFTRPGNGGAETQGSVAGTFSLALIHGHDDARGGDILFTFPWTSNRNGFGIPGTDVGDASSPVTSDHGSMSPWNIRNTLVAWGPGFKSGVTIRTPAGNVDVAPTVLQLLGLDSEGPGLDGRVLHEALANGPDEEQVVAETRSHTVATTDDSYRAVVQTSEVAGRRYVDKGWRIT
jgi:arylsulfatase A-like enzyme